MLHSQSNLSDLGSKGCLFKFFKSRSGGCSSSVGRVLAEHAQSPGVPSSAPPCGVVKPVIQTLEHVGGEGRRIRNSGSVLGAIAQYVRPCIGKKKKSSKVAYELCTTT